MDVIKRLLGSSKKPESERPSQTDPAPDSRTFQVDHAQATTRRELVRVVTRDTQRACGIPDGWIESLVLLEPGRGGQTFVHLRLLVKHWDMRLLTYAVAFQTRLMEELRGFDAAAPDWLLSVSWQYQVGESCPFQSMPPPEEWQRAAQATRASAIAQAAVATQDAPALAGLLSAFDPIPDRQEPDEVSEDLAQLFAIRDANMPSGKQPT